jgi:hypothetical protein
VTFHFLPGSYSCSGINAMSGWHFVGSGQSTTTIHVTGGSYASDSSKVMNPTQGISCSDNARDIQVKNLTLDGGVRETGIPVSTGFTMPRPRESVEVTVSNPALLSLGKWYYVQDAAMINGQQKWWGIMTCTAINGSTVTLQNAEVPAVGSITGDITAGSPLVRNISSTTNLEEGQTIECPSFAGGTAIVASVDTSTQITLSANATTTANRVTLTYAPCFTDNGSGDVPATACLFPAGSRTGIVLQSNDIQIVNVTVQDVALPFAEGPVGIAVNNSPPNQAAGAGNLIKGCTVQDVFGLYGDYISADNYPGTNGITEQVSLKKNIISGNGYGHAFELAGISNSVIAGNTVTHVNTGLSCVSGDSASDTISGNSFSGANGIFLGVAAPGNFVGGAIRNNTVTLTSANGTGIRLTDNVSDVTISGNTITIENSGDGSEGIVLDRLSADPSSNTIADNQIASSLTTEGIDGGTNQTASSQTIQRNAVTGMADTIALQASPAISLRTDPGSQTTSSNSATTTSSSDPTPEVISLAAGDKDPKTPPSNSNPAAGTSLDPESAMAQRLTQDVALLEALSSGSATSQLGTGPNSAKISALQKKDPNDIQDTKLLAELDALINQLQSEIQK